MSYQYPYPDFKSLFAIIVKKSIPKNHSHNVPPLTTTSLSTATRCSWSSWKNSTPTAFLFLSKSILVAVELSMMWRLRLLRAGLRKARAVESREPLRDVVWAIMKPVCERPFKSTVGYPGCANRD